MSCCSAGADAAGELESWRNAVPSRDELREASLPVEAGVMQIDFSVPDIHCGACISTIEKGLGELDIVKRARVNMSTKRVKVLWEETGDPSEILSKLHKLGYEAHLFDPVAEEVDRTMPMLLRSLAVAGFAAANIMLLSVSVWSGAEASTRDLFHWISALIAIPALAYSGRVFYRSAFSALRNGHLNMDVPITLAVLLAFGASLYETAHSGEQVYFDASVTLLFFLLIGRVLDHAMREKARSAVTGLQRLAPRGAMVVLSDGSREFCTLDDIEPGMTILLAAGDRVPVDGRIVRGESELDCSLVTGESEPQRASAGAVVRAGTLNLTGVLTMEATASAGRSFLAEMVRLMEAAEGGRARYRRIADRAAELYAPAVHLVAFAAFTGWLVVSGDLQHALFIAIAVLIITCPCALGLAVPVVQVIAAGRLFENGIMVKDGSAMERLAVADVAVFDKTGTLTVGEPRLVGADDVPPDLLRIAAAIGKHSRHPLASALGRSVSDNQTDAIPIGDCSEVPGNGVEAVIDGRTWRLGRSSWALRIADGGSDSGSVTQSILTVDGSFRAAFGFEDELRPDAASTLSRLQDRGLSLEILSGDRVAVVSRLAKLLGISVFRAGILPADKQSRVKVLENEGHRVLMVGDGINDAPALAAAYVSMAPASAADVGRSASDFVFMHKSLGAVVLARDMSVRAGRLIRQNFGLAIAYNLVAVPCAVLGFASPLVAAIAMSSSSILVVLNSLRLRIGTNGPAEPVSPAVGTARDNRPFAATEIGV